MQRTRRRLHEALLDRVLEKKYESITVQDILDLAEVGRSTFYSHFRDKDELLISGFRSFKAAIDAVGPSAPGPRVHEWVIASSLPMFEHAARYRAVHRALLGSRVERLVHRNLYSVFRDIIGERVAHAVRVHKPREPRVSPELLTLFLVATQISVLNWWLDAPKPLPVVEVDAMYKRLALPVLTSIFDSDRSASSVRGPR